MENPINRKERIADKKETSQEKLLEKGLTESQIQNVWARADDEYFVRESSANIVWHTEGITNFDDDGPLILIQDIS